MSTVNIMVDLETLGVTINPVIMQISACHFDIKTGEIKSEFNAFVNPSSCDEFGLRREKAQIDFWNSMSETGIKQTAESEGVDLPTALKQFSKYISGARKSIGGVTQLALWSYGPASDGVWLESAYDATKIKCPWTYQNHRDVRTVIKIGDMRGICTRDIDFAGVQHDARSDVLHQVKMIVHVLNS